MFLEKMDKNDDNLILELSPPRKEGNENARIDLTLFENPLVINKGDGLCFLCYESVY